MALVSSSAYLINDFLHQTRVRDASFASLHDADNGGLQTDTLRQQVHASYLAQTWIISLRSSTTSLCALESSATRSVCRDLLMLICP